MQSPPEGARGGAGLVFVVLVQGAPGPLPGGPPGRKRAPHVHSILILLLPNAFLARGDAGLTEPRVQAILTRRVVTTVASVPTTAVKPYVNDGFTRVAPPQSTEFASWGLTGEHVIEWVPWLWW